MKADSLKDNTLQHTTTTDNGEVETTAPENPGLQRGLASRHLVSRDAPLGPEHGSRDQANKPGACR